ncbi:hypothetical protein BD410DRAFT_761905 [Rickenella mellea]|uniref:R3H domain protein n=1 Tax=Rickenella mellea TaxID=50990 RepID=A0A4Y7QJ05_9AGAM|nr:hypothetical protein BD410DRAFT_761905 [Rickenella mellea]
MSSPAPPDMSSLSISPSSQQRLYDSYDFEGNGAANARQQFLFSTSPAISGQSPYNNGLPINQSSLKSRASRAGLPTQWLENQSSMTDSRSLSPPNTSDLSSGGGSPPMSHLSGPPMQPTTPGQNIDDEVIPTAIVIKNIPFNVKRETLLEIIASLQIPTPYAFNYHLDPQGAFRGLAFANFRQSADADAVVAALNGFDVQGRKLRVEYKKVLQAGEKERIEREKAIRRMRSMQMEKEQQQYHDEFGPVAAPMFSQPRSFSGAQPPIASPYPPQQPSPPHMQSMPMQVQQPYGVSSPPIPPTTPTQSAKATSTTELDLNDPSTLEIYSRILLFKDDHMRDELAFSRTLSPKQRRVVHLVAQKLGVYHYSVGEGEERYAVVTRINPETRHQPQTLSRAPSAYITPSAPQVPTSSLRTKKSMPDMKTLHTQTPRLNTRSSNGNIREGYATIASPSRRSPGGFGSLFGNGAFGNNSGGSSIPPVPSLPANLSTSLNGGGGSLNDGPGSGVVRQPRGPSGGTGFSMRRDQRVVASESSARIGLEARSHEPLEI